MKKVNEFISIIGNENVTLLYFGERGDYVYFRSSLVKASRLKVRCLVFQTSKEPFHPVFYQSNAEEREKDFNELVELWRNFESNNVSYLKNKNVKYVILDQGYLTEQHRYIKRLPFAYRYKLLNESDYTLEFESNSFRIYEIY